MLCSCKSRLLAQTLPGGACLPLRTGARGWQLQGVRRQMWTGGCALALVSCVGRSCSSDLIRTRLPAVTGPPGVDACAATTWSDTLQSTLHKNLEHPISVGQQYAAVYSSHTYP